MHGKRRRNKSPNVNFGSMQMVGRLLLALRKKESEKAKTAAAKGGREGGREGGNVLPWEGS